MLKIILGLIYSLLIFFGFTSYEKNINRKEDVRLDSLSNAISWPDELIVNNFAWGNITPSPACIAVAASGEVYVGVDQIGSFGHMAGKGYVLRLVDTNNDGKADKHTQFAMADNPRGILPMGDKVYVLHSTFSADTKKARGMDLVVYEDKNKDGIADGPSQILIKNICSAKALQDQGADHASNGIRMGIDGWIYIACGDFGFHEATDRAGTKLTVLGGSIVRVRPDGTEIEVYTHGTRNIYDVAIDPYMNMFTRDNTNNGASWNTRFSHQIQSAEYGYPTLFRNFTEEIIPALSDLGGGASSGTLFMDEPSWPSKYNQVLMTADWGTNSLYINRLTADGPSYTHKQEDFIKLRQITDLDVDGSGRLYLSAWDGAGYTGSPDKGFIVRATPKEWKYKAFPELKKLSVKQLGDLLQSSSAVARLNAQQELLSRDAKDVSRVSLAIASDRNLPLYARVAGIYTYTQVAKAEGISNLIKLSTDEALREFALRALSDRKTLGKNVPLEPFINGINDASQRVQLASIIGMGRLNNPTAVSALLKIKVPPSFAAPSKGKEGPHATANPAIIPAHIAVKSLVSLHAVDAVVKAIGTENSTIALWSLRYMHDPAAVSGLINTYKKTANAGLKKQIIDNLSRLYRKEAPFEAQFWWNNKPIVPGPYYRAIEWTESENIKNFLLDEWKAGSFEKEYFTAMNDKYQLKISEFEAIQAVASTNEVTIDLEKIKNVKGQVGSASLEDVLLAMTKIKGDPTAGRALLSRQGCVACHSINKGDALKGPYLGQIGAIMTREKIAESILKPNESLAQGFATVSIATKDNKGYVGFITAETPELITLRDIGGLISTIKVVDIASRKRMDNSMMPAGLANGLSYEEFASLITFLSEQKVI